VRSLPNIVLVHGAFADGSSWSGVIELLQAEGYKVSAPQLREGLAPLLHPRSPTEAIQ
jgi:pimeloyl-ACP methyl ester carboxylesterase